MYCQMCGKTDATSYKDPPAGERFFCSTNCKESYFESFAEVIFLNSTRINLGTGARSQVGAAEELNRAQAVKRYCWSCGRQHVMNDETCTSCGKLLDMLRTA